MIGWIIAKLTKLMRQDAHRTDRNVSNMLGYPKLTTVTREYVSAASNDDALRPEWMVFPRGGRLPVSVGPDFVSTAEISELSGLPMREVRRDIAKGLIPGAIPTAHGWCAPKVSVEAYLQRPKRPYSPRKPRRVG